MAYWSVAFLLIAVAAGMMGLRGVGGLSAATASGLFLAALLLALFALVLGRQKTARRFGSRARGRQA